MFTGVTGIAGVIGFTGFMVFTGVDSRFRTVLWFCRGL